MDSPPVNAADVVRILIDEIADLHRRLAIMQARAELAERRLSVMNGESSPVVPATPTT